MTPSLYDCLLSFSYVPCSRLTYSLHSIVKFFFFLDVLLSSCKVPIVNSSTLREISTTGKGGKGIRVLCRGREREDLEGPYDKQEITVKQSRTKDRYMSPLVWD